MVPLLPYLQDILVLEVRVERVLPHRLQNWCSIGTSLELEVQVDALELDLGCLGNEKTAEPNPLARPL